MQGKRKLYLIGASNLGREVESWIEFLPENKRDYVLAGFLHTSYGDTKSYGIPSDFKILGEWETYPLTKNDYCLITVADPVWKERIYESLKGKTSFLTFIAHNAVIGKFNKIGEGSIVCPNCVVTTNVTLGKHVFLNIGTQVGHDVVIGDYCSFMANIDLGGYVQIGKSVFVGSKATVIPKTEVGDNAIIGAGSVVVKKVKKDTTVFGNPAKVIFTHDK